jgi:prepilin-type N-terminal cleavage/methylation domain-containing protein
MNKNKGFTLIELLVVIAIIGILSSVVLASLSNARDKGKDASVKSQLASLKAQGELYFSASETYSGVCNEVKGKNGFKDLLIATADVSGVESGASLNDTNGDGVLLTDAVGVYNKVTCHEYIGNGTESNPDAWVVEAPLSASTQAAPSMYCADSTGVSKVTSTGVLTAGQKACGN